MSVCLCMYECACVSTCVRTCVHIPISVEIHFNDGYSISIKV